MKTILYACCALLGLTTQPVLAQLDLSKAKWIGEPQYAREATGQRLGYRSATTQRQDDYLWVQLDLGEDRRMDQIRVHAARLSDAADAPAYLMPQAFTIYTDRNERFDKTFMRLAATPEGAVAGTEPVNFPLSAYKLRFIRLVATKLAPVEGGGYAFALGEIELLDGGVNITRHAKVTAQTSVEADGWTRLALVDGELRPKDAAVLRAQRAQPEPAVAVRRDFFLQHKPVQATLTVATRGIARTRINGQELPTGGLGSGFVDAHSVVYTRHDVGALLQQGANAIGALLTPGWASGRGELATLAALPAIGLGVDLLPRYMAQLDIVCAGQAPLTIVTDGKWVWSQAGGVRGADLFEGELHNAFAGLGAWDKAGFDESAWNPVAADEAGQAAQSLRRTAVGVGTRRSGAQLRYAPQASTWTYDFGASLTGALTVRLQAQPYMRAAWRYALSADEEGRLQPPQGDGATDRHLCMARTPEQWSVLGGLHRFRYAQLTLSENYQPVIPPAEGEVEALVVEYAPIELGLCKLADGAAQEVANELMRRPHLAFDEVRRWFLRRHCGVDLPDGEQGEWLYSVPSSERGSVEWMQASQRSVWSWINEGPTTQLVAEIPAGVTAALLYSLPDKGTLALNGNAVTGEPQADGTLRLALPEGRQELRVTR